MKLSMCIPLYNKARYIETTLRQIRRQTDVDIEIVVVNNASTDISRQRLEGLADRYRLTLHHLPQTISIQENWFLAMSLGSGEIVNLHLADDGLVEGSLEGILRVFEQQPAIDYVVGDSIAMNGDEEDPGNDYFSFVRAFRAKLHAQLTAKEKARLFLSGFMKRSNPFGDPNALFFRRKCLETLRRPIDHVAPAAKSYPDLELFLRLFANFSGAYAPHPVSRFYYRDDSPAMMAQRDPAYQQDGYTSLRLAGLMVFLTDTVYHELRKEISLSDQLKILNAVLATSLRETAGNMGMPASPNLDSSHIADGVPTSC